MTEAS